MSQNAADSPSITLEETIPLGRNAGEYNLMFNLSGIRDTATYIDCGAGPSSFNAEMSVAERTVVSVDPLYDFTASDLSARAKTTLEGIMQQVNTNREKYRWDIFRSVDQLKQSRTETMQRFLADYDDGKKQGRYITASLPQLPFEDKQFDIALCSHLLFLYDKIFSLDFHLQAIREMMRVAGEVRIFPLVDLNGQPSVHLRDVIKTFRNEQHHTQIINVPYEFQKGVNQCLLIRKKRPIL